MQYPTSIHRKPLLAFVVIFQLVCGGLLGFVSVSAFSNGFADLFLIPVILALLTSLIWIVSSFLSLTFFQDTSFARSNLVGALLLGGVVLSTVILFFTGSASFITVPLFVWIVAVFDFVSGCLLLISHFTSEAKLPETTRSFVGIVISLVTFDALLLPWLATTLVAYPSILNGAWIIVFTTALHIIVSLVAICPLLRSGSKQHLGLYMICSIISSVADILAGAGTLFFYILGSRTFIHKRSVQSGAFISAEIALLLFALVVLCGLFVLARLILTIISAVQARRIKNEVDYADPEELSQLNHVEEYVLPQAQVPVYIPVHVQSVHPAYQAFPILRN